MKTVKVDHPYIELFVIEEVVKNQFQLSFLCKQKNLMYHDYNDNEYFICATENEYDDISPELIIRIPNFLPELIKATTYKRIPIVYDNLIMFNFIPYTLKTLRNE